MLWGEKRAIAVGGGKGGVGKSSFTANLGVILARKGHSVVLVDADLGAANLHTITGVTYPERTLDDFIHGRQSVLENTLLDTPYPGMKLLSSASDILSIAAPNYSQRQKLLRGIQKLKADTVIFDIAAGTHSRAIDFFSIATNGIIIIEPTPTSLENAYSFLKNLMVRHLMRIFYSEKPIKDFIVSATDPRNPGGQMQVNELLENLARMHPEKTEKYRSQFLSSANRFYLVVNAVRSARQFDVSERFARIIKRYLTLDMKVLGALPFEMQMDEAITARTPFVIRYPDSGYARGIEHIADRLLE